MPTIHTRIEGPRGCGRRKQGGTYLVSDGPGRPCGLIPFPLENCPTCNHGIKLIRSWTWITIKPILDSLPACPHLDRRIGPAPFVGQAAPCWSCPLHIMAARVGLLTVGSRFYAMPADFMAEVEKMGLSRRIPAVPKDLVLGSTWVMLAHRRALPRPCIEDRGFQHEATELGLACKHCERLIDDWMGPGVFYVFQPQRIEYVVKDDDPVDKLERLDKRGITLVKIEPLDDDGQLSLGQGGEARV